MPELAIDFALAAGVGLFLVFVSVKKAVLTPPAAMTAFALLFCVAAGGGWRALVYITVIFLLMALVHLLNLRKKNRHADGARGVCQVLCNGGVGAAAMLLLFLTKEKSFLYIYYAAIGEALADTLASDIGTLFPGRPYDPFRRCFVERGRSGGMSLGGTAVSLFGTGAAFGLTLLLGAEPLPAAIALGSAFFGMLFDSFLGSLVQERFLCLRCGAYTEKPFHCGYPARRTGGIPGLSNSAVNFVSNLFTALLTALLLLLLG